MQNEEAKRSDFDVEISTFRRLEPRLYRALCKKIESGTGPFGNSVFVVWFVITSKRCRRREVKGYINKNSGLVREMIRALSGKEYSAKDRVNLLDLDLEDKECVIDVEVRKGKNNAITGYSPISDFPDIE